MKDYPNSHPFDVTAKVGNREIVWQRYAPNIQAAIDSAKEAIAESYGTRAVRLARREEGK